MGLWESQLRGLLVRRKVRIWQTWAESAQLHAAKHLFSVFHLNVLGKKRQEKQRKDFSFPFPPFKSTASILALSDFVRFPFEVNSRGAVWNEAKR